MDTPVPRAGCCIKVYVNGKKRKVFKIALSRKVVEGSSIFYSALWGFTYSHHTIPLILDPNLNHGQILDTNHHLWIGVG